MKDIKLYAQLFQGNEYYPVDCFERKDDVWYSGLEKTDSKGISSFNMLKSFDGEYGNYYFFYLFDHNYCVFSSKEILSGNKMHKGDMTLEDVHKLIYEE